MTERPVADDETVAEDGTGAQDDPRVESAADVDAEAPADEDPVSPPVSEPGDGVRSDVPASGQVQTELIALREEFEDLNDRHLRLVAEFNNFKRRSEQERLAAWGRAQADLVGRLLDVLDDLQRVAQLDLSNATVETIMEGIDLVERKFVRQLDDASVETIEPEGAAFDPELMEAMMRVPAEEEEQVDTVAQVFQKGYALKGNLIRPARVSVYTSG